MAVWMIKSLKCLKKDKVNIMNIFSKIRTGSEDWVKRGSRVERVEPS